MKKALLSVAMAAVISLSATAVSSTVVGAVSSNLATPKITKAESVDGGVKISWNKSNGAEKYRVYYKGSKGWTRMVDTTSTSYIDKDVSSGKNYTYTVRCINSSATKFTSGYDSKGKSVKYISAPKISIDKIKHPNPIVGFRDITDNWRIFIHFRTLTIQIEYHPITE